MRSKMFLTTSGLYRGESVVKLTLIPSDLIEGRLNLLMEIERVALVKVAGDMEEAAARSLLEHITSLLLSDSAHGVYTITREGVVKGFDWAAIERER